MTEHLTEARACLSRVDQAATHFSAVSWLTATCEHILDHLEAQRTPARKEPPMTDPKLHGLLDQTQFGDRLTLAHSNGKHTASISGPVLTDQTHDPAVGIHLLDGDPHIVRNSTGVIWAPVVQAALYRGGEVIAKWDAADRLEAQQTEASLQRGLADITAGRTDDLGSFAQPATDPPAAQQCDSGHRDGNFMDWMADRLADPEVRAGYLAAHEREVRAQIASELIPVVAHKGPNDTDLSLLDEAAHKLEHGYSFGSNVTAAVVRLIRNAIHIARKEQP